jgi:hypothetical protein
MKIDKEDIQDITEMIRAAEDLKPLWDATLKAASVFLPDIQEGMRKLGDHMAAENVRRFKFYTTSGFTREEAMLLILSTRLAVEMAVQNAGKK